MSSGLSSEKLELFERTPIARAVATLAIPTVISQLITTVYNLADAYFVGQLNDPNQLGAITLVMSVQLSLTALANLFGVGAGTMVSRLLGAREYEKAKRTSAFAVYSSVAVMVVYALAITVFRAPFMHLLGSTPALDPYVKDYLFWVVVLGGVPSIFNMVVGHLIRAEGGSKEASFGLSMGGILNMVLDPFFIHSYGLGLEVKGAAIATFLSNCATMVYFIWYLCKTRNTRVMSVAPRYYTFSKEIALPVLAVGLPSALQMLLSSVSNTVLNNTLVRFDETAIAAVGICKKVDSIPAYILMGVTTGVVPLIAYNYGAKNQKRLREGIRFTIMTVVVMAVIFTAVLQLVPGVIAACFIEDPQTVTYASGFIRIHCLALPFTGITFLLTGLFQALKKSRQATVLSMIRKGVFDIPLMFALNAVIPLYGPIMCQPIMDIVAAVCAIVMYSRVKKEIAIEA